MGQFGIFKVCRNAYFVVFSRVWGGFQREILEEKKEEKEVLTISTLFLFVFSGGGGLEGGVGRFRLRLR